jgi:hypothetical protein
LLPEQRLGLFVSYNGSGSTRLVLNGETLAAFTDHFFPARQAPLPAPPSDFGGRAGDFTGTYQRNNQGGSVTTAEKFTRLFGTGSRTITAPGDGTLSVTTAGAPRTYVEVDPLFFREVGGQDTLLFRRGPDGQIARAYFSGVPVYTYETVAWYAAPAAGLGMLAGAALLMLSVIGVAIAGWAAGRKRPAVGSGYARAAWRVLVGAAAVQLLFLAGLALELSSPALLWGDFTRVRVLLVLPLVGAALSAGALLGVAAVWRTRSWSRLFRVYYVVSAITVVAFVVLLNSWNLLGFHI